MAQDKSTARTLRKNSTDAERKLWRHLRYRQLAGHRFRRQHPIGTYIVDFVCLEQHLVIEVDGAHHLDQAKPDAARDAWLASRGYRVLRFTDREALMEITAVKQAIGLALGNGEDDPPP
jgi:very-short-patch-repair endonuclease